MNFASLSTPIALVGLVVLALADLGLRGDDHGVFAVIAALLTWLQVKPPPTPPAPPMAPA
jgi:hypothetical protein